MFSSVLIPPSLNADELDSLVDRLAEEIRPHVPDGVIYIERGGGRGGRRLARALGVPAIGLDLSYPLRRTLETRIPPLHLALWPVRELIYRTTKPTIRATAPFPIEPCRATSLTRPVLFDDSASSGKTLRAAIHLLENAGMDKDQIRIAVIRCGSGAKRYVDHFATQHRVRMPSAV